MTKKDIEKSKKHEDEKEQEVEKDEIEEPLKKKETKMTEETLPVIDKNLEDDSQRYVQNS